LNIRKARLTLGIWDFKSHHASLLNLINQTVRGATCHCIYRDLHHRILESFNVIFSGVQRNLFASVFCDISKEAVQNITLLVKVANKRVVPTWVEFTLTNMSSYTYTSIATSGPSLVPPGGDMHQHLSFLPWCWPADSAVPCCAVLCCDAGLPALQSLLDCHFLFTLVSLILREPRDILTSFKKHLITPFCSLNFLVINEGARFCFVFCRTLKKRHLDCVCYHILIIVWIYLMFKVLSISNLNSPAS
jgi:hypothetical protein